MSKKEQSLHSKFGALTTRILILKGKKLERKERGQRPDAELEAMIRELEKERKAVVKLLPKPTENEAA